jgi:hypothetical protein
MPARDVLVATVSDATSGVADAALELRAVGTEDWVRLPGQLNDDRLVATLDGVPAGTYELRGTAADVAGNRTVVSEFADGSQATVTVDPPPTSVGVAAPAQPQRAAPSPLAKPVSRAKVSYCVAKGKRAKRSHGKRRRKTCRRVHRKGGEKHRSRHLAGKTHKPARRTAG